MYQGIYQYFAAPGDTMFGAPGPLGLDVFRTHDDRLPRFNGENVHTP